LMETLLAAFNTGSMMDRFCPEFTAGKL